MVTAYEKWLVKQADFQELTSTDPELDAKQIFIAQTLIGDCMQQNPQAFDLVAKVGDDAGFTKETFYKAAKMVIDNVNGVLV
jgi:hypothetical protein